MPHPLKRKAGGGGGEAKRQLDNEAGLHPSVSSVAERSNAEPGAAATHLDGCVITWVSSGAGPERNLQPQRRCRCAFGPGLRLPGARQEGEGGRGRLQIATAKLNEFSFVFFFFFAAAGVRVAQRDDSQPPRPRSGSHTLLAVTKTLLVRGTGAAPAHGRLKAARPALVSAERGGPARGFPCAASPAPGGAVGAAVLRPRSGLPGSARRPRRRRASAAPGGAAAGPACPGQRRWGKGRGEASRARAALKIGGPGLAKQRAGIAPQPVR